MSARRHKRRGNVVVLIAILVPILAGLGAFAIDVGYIGYSRSQLQAGADAAALAAAEELPGDQTTLDAIGVRYVTLNIAQGSDLQITVEGGTWDEDAATFAPGSLSSANAVRVTAVSKDISLFFGPLLGKSFVDASASAVAARLGGVGTRFLIDDEMIDTDVPAIESLAQSLGREPEELLTPRGFNRGKLYGSTTWAWDDNFIDLPAGETLNLPTGQGTDYDNNDAGMFDIDHPEFPFTDDDTFMQFLMYSESGNDPTKWGTDHNNIYQQSDPLQGASPVTDGSTYDSFVNPDFVHVSPVTFSDVSPLNMQGGIPQLNAKGLRRGLMAFKIMAVGADVDGSGSVLPELVVETVDPTTIDPTNIKPPGQHGGGKIRLVQ